MPTQMIQPGELAAKKRGRGRQPIGPEPQLARSIRLSDSDYKTLMSLGGATWLRSALARARDAAAAAAG